MFITSEFFFIHSRSNDSEVGTKKRQWNEQSGAQVMSLDDGGDETSDPFIEAMRRFEQGAAYYEPLRCDREMLQLTPSNEVEWLRCYVALNDSGLFCL